LKKVVRLLLFISMFLGCSTLFASACQEPVSVIVAVNFNGNEITKEQVLLRELTLLPGDSVITANLDSLLEENRKRLLNLRLFHHVNYTYTCEGGQVQVIYDIQERFYLYPIPIFDVADRNFNAWLEKKDFSRLDYGISLIRKNFRGRNEELRLRLQRGFNRRLELVYRNPYMVPHLKLGADFGVSDYRSRTISYNVLGHRQAFYEQEKGVPIRRTSVFGSIYHRENVQRQSILRISYLSENISDAVAELNPEYFGDGDVSRESFRLDLIRVVNLRNNFVYPLTGSYFEVGIGQALFTGETGSSFTGVRAKYVTYHKLSKKFYYTVGAEAQARFSKEYAFTDNIALGYRSQVRGYELYVIGGQHYALFRQGLTHELLNISGVRLNFIKNPKFNTVPLALYLNAFTDAGYTIDNHFAESNPLTNRWLFGTGLGVHFVTFYDIVGRVEYTFNREGDKGLFLSAGFPF
jgi:outer membrane protein assembly factor BamA